jgi:hypothetical protein
MCSSPFCFGAARSSRACGLEVAAIFVFVSVEGFHFCRCALVSLAFVFSLAGFPTQDRAMLLGLSYRSDFPSQGRCLAAGFASRFIALVVRRPAL